MNISVKLLLLTAASTGLMHGTGTAQPATASPMNGSGAVSSRLGGMPSYAATEKHACKGQNTCKGNGGCNTGDMGCKAKNSCKGKGGCKTDM